MVDVTEIIARGTTGRTVLNFLEGYVSTERPAPGAFSDPVWVIVPSHSSDFAYGPMAWPAIHGNTMPLPGARCLIALDNQNAPWLLSWDGQHS